MTVALDQPEALIIPRPGVSALLPSRIREIANAGMGRTDLAAFWFGESDRPTPAFIREAGMASLAAGETYYTQNLGRPALREALSRYVSGLHGVEVAPERIVVTGSGVSALMLVAQMLVSPGDRVVMITPIWPNIAEIPRILGGEVARVPLTISGGRWSLDLERLLAALTPETRLLVINSPSNPTGWTIDRGDQIAILAHCRRHGIWVMSDDVYERLVYTGTMGVAPSMLGLAGPEDRVISVNSFSKAWCMTGWRVGWIVAPEALMPDFTKVIEYNTSCVADFIQHGAIAALSPNRGEAAVADLLHELKASRRLLLEGLREFPEIECPEADGAMYAFFRIAGRSDDMPLARELIDTAGLGLAPGSAFGPEGEGWLRWCFAARPEKIVDGLGKLERFLRR
ncbi:MAG: aspartate aminotransferase [Devosia sp.]|nr:aspartate aminotransferase [Devosia sp.]